jgi:hypothetical protein
MGKSKRKQYSKKLNKLKNNINKPKQSEDLLYLLVDFSGICQLIDNLLIGYNQPVEHVIDLVNQYIPTCKTYNKIKNNKDDIINLCFSVIANFVKFRELLESIISKVTVCETLEELKTYSKEEVCMAPFFMLDLNGMINAYILFQKQDKSDLENVTILMTKCFFKKDVGYMSSSMQCDNKTVVEKSLFEYSYSQQNDAECGVCFENFKGDDSFQLSMCPYCSFALCRKCSYEINICPICSKSLQRHY